MKVVMLIFLDAFLKKSVSPALTDAREVGM